MSYASWNDGCDGYPDWRIFLAGLVGTEWNRAPRDRELGEELIALTDAIERATDLEAVRAAGLAYVGLSEEAEYDAVHYAVLLAYGLGRTAGGPESHDPSWLARAKALVGLGDPSSAPGPSDGG
jgi:hypothetical protein